ncbi:hypothetical protein JW964_03885 [candidate division KSB1 bacterium]|nr:hypothetical protein [candidate division KSB1 bacterium]
MKHQNPITLLVILISIIAIIATSFGIFSSQGTGEYVYKSIRGEDVTIYGKGIYQHMSADVAIQGIAQDYVTLFLGIPILLVSLILAKKGSNRARFVLSGVSGYFLLTYLFYTAMAMYNIMFLAYIILLGTSFFTFILTLFSYDTARIKDLIRSEKLVRHAGLFLIINGSMVALLWLSVILPPLINGSIYPTGLQHYTTLIVQGFDLGLFLPMAFVAGILARKKNVYGYLLTIIYVIFLTLLMTALTSKILFMANAGANVIPVIFIMPTIGLISLIFSILLIKNIK